MNLIPSLLFRDCDFKNMNLREADENSYVKNDLTIATSRHANTAILPPSAGLEQKIAIASSNNIHEDKIQRLSESILEQEQRIKHIKHEINLERSILSEVSLVKK